ncbi:hypothetical protein [Lentzea flava]|uniref:Uncharacterized protein n=1 Tax=Lentzea flava TaxID=103732 RepID=A0ABQ2UIW7_9PSEU|nr:hypothetical protein [Lentzea flava]MCP2199058.1 hypothetical protein [Lentzea flava]GGU34798.1 hypothetical protein GCM10010178_28900 [Lentzea flava]
MFGSRRRPTVQTVGGRSFTVYSEMRNVGPETAAGTQYEERHVWISTAIGPCPPLRVSVRGSNHLDDRNDGAVATGVPAFDDRFLVHCDDIAFVRRVTPALTAAPRESTGFLELRGGWITVHRTGTEHDGPAANYLNALIPLLPPELRR